MSEVYVVGVAQTRFQRWPERDFRDLAREVVEGVLRDAGLAAGDEVAAASFGNCAMGVWGQPNIRGQVALGPLLREGRLPERMPIVNVEAGCATGSAAFNVACKEVRAGEAELALAIGVEKVFVPDDLAKTFGLFLGGIDQRHPGEWQDFFAAEAAAHDERFEPDPRRVVFLDVHALQARRHMARYGTTARQIAAVAAKNHHHGHLNEDAQLRFEIDVDAVLADKPVVAPFTRAMCAPIGDGAAAALLCSERWLRAQPAEVRERAVRVRASVLTGGAWRGLDEPSVVAHAAKAAYARAGLGPAEIDVAEVHDSTAFCELAATEALGFAEEGKGGAYAESGATALGGARPTNLSGGLESKGHPLGATGLGMVAELALQLRAEAGARQARGARVGLAQNAGGLIGLDEALCGITILER